MNQNLGQINKIQSGLQNMMPITAFYLLLLRADTEIGIYFWIENWHKKFIKINKKNWHKKSHEIKRCTLPTIFASCFSFPYRGNPFKFKPQEKCQCLCCYAYLNGGHAYSEIYDNGHDHISDFIFINFSLFFLGPEVRN